MKLEIYRWDSGVRTLWSETDFSGDGVSGRAGHARLCLTGRACQCFVAPAVQQCVVQAYAMPCPPLRGERTESRQCQEQGLKLGGAFPGGRRRPSSVHPHRA